MSIDVASLKRQHIAFLPTLVFEIRTARTQHTMNKKEEHEDAPPAGCGPDAAAVGPGAAAAGTAPAGCPGQGAVLAAPDHERQCLSRHQPIIKDRYASTYLRRRNLICRRLDAHARMHLLLKA